MDESFAVLEDLMRLTHIRHKVLASNIANADTPGYKAKDINFKKYFDRATLELSSTHDRHITLSSDKNSMGDRTVIEYVPSWGDRNNVELDIEMAKMTENALLGEASIKLLSTKIRMFKDAVRRR